MKTKLRKTKIICTLGPASESEEVIRELMLAGMNVARLNFSHGTHEEQRGKLELVKKVREELGLPVAEETLLLLDGTAANSQADAAVMDAAVTALLSLSHALAAQGAVHSVCWRAAPTMSVSSAMTTSPSTSFAARPSRTF